MNKGIMGLVSWLLILGCVFSVACSKTGESTPLSESTPPSSGWPYAFQGMLQLSGPGLSSMDIELGAHLSNQPYKAPAYKIIYPQVDENYAVDIARRLGFTGEPGFAEITSAPLRSRYVFENEGYILEVALNGSILLFDNNSYAECPKYLPSDEECIAIASRWLKDHGLYPDNVVDITISSDRRAELRDKETGILIDSCQMGTMMHFSVAIDGTNLDWGGAWVMVGDNGAIIYASTNNPTLEKVYDVPLKDVDQAFAILKDRLTSQAPPSMDNLECIVSHSQLTKLVITDIELRYLFSVANDYVLPIYTFIGIGYDERPEMVYEYEYWQGRRNFALATSLFTIGEETCLSIS